MKHVQPIQPALGIRIRQLRCDGGLSQEKVAERCELSVDQLSNIERGKSFARPETLRLLASVFGLDDVQQLFDYSGNDAFVKRGGMKCRVSRSASPLIVRKGKVEVVIPGSKRNPKEG